MTISRASIPQQLKGGKIKRKPKKKPHVPTKLKKRTNK